METRLPIAATKRAASTLPKWHGPLLPLAQLLLRGGPSSPAESYPRRTAPNDATEAPAAYSAAQLTVAEAVGGGEEEGDAVGVGASASVRVVLWVALGGCERVRVREGLREAAMVVEAVGWEIVDVAEGLRESGGFTDGEQASERVEMLVSDGVENKEVVEVLVSACDWVREVALRESETFGVSVAVCEALGVNS